MRMTVGSILEGFAQRSNGVPTMFHSTKISTANIQLRDKYFTRAEGTFRDALKCSGVSDGFGLIA